jgi:hypothetical protein
MLKTLSQLEFEIGENAYSFTCNPNSPLAEVKEALCQFLTFVGTVEQKHKEAQANAEAQAQQNLPVSDEVKAEETQEANAQ